jgi:hypothetical protein
VDYESLYQAALAIGINESDLTLATMAGSSNFTTSDSVMDILLKLWNVVTNAGQIAGASYALSNTIQGVYSTPSFNTSYKTLDFGNVSFLVDRPATYLMIFSVDGVEVKSGKIVITDNPVEEDANEVEKVEEVLPFVLIALLIIANIPNLNRYFILVAICGCSVQLYYLTRSTLGSSYQIFGFSIVSILLFLNVIMFMDDVMKNGRTIFSEEKDQAFLEYTRRLINSLEKKDADQSKEEEELKAENKEDDEKNEKGKDKDKDKNEKGFCLLLREVFVPFHFAKNNDKGDAFYYPQRFLLAIILGFVAFVYVVFQLWIFFFSLLDT